MLNVSLSNFIANSPKPSPASCLSIVMKITDAGSYILKSQYLPVTGSSTIFCNTNAMSSAIQYAIHSVNTNMQCNYANYFCPCRVSYLCIFAGVAAWHHDSVTVMQYNGSFCCSLSCCFSLQIYIFAECFHEKCDEKKKILINIIIEHWEPTLHIWRYGWRGHPREQDESKVQETIWNS